MPPYRLQISPQQGSGTESPAQGWFPLLPPEHTEIFTLERPQKYIITSEDCMKKLEKGKRQLGESKHGELKTESLRRR